MNLNELEKVEVDGNINVTGVDGGIKVLDEILAIPLAEITNDDQYNEIKARKNSFEMTEKGITQGAIPTLKRIVGEIKSKIGILATLEDYVSKSVAYKNKLDALLKNYVANRFNYKVIEEWNGFIETYVIENDVIMTLNTFTNFKAKVDLAVKGMSSEEKKEEKLKLVAEEFKNDMVNKDKEFTIIYKTITDKVKPIYQSEIKAKIPNYMTLADAIILIDNFIAEKEGLEKIEAERENMIEAEAKRLLKDPIPMPTKVDKVALHTNQKTIYYGNDVKDELTKFFNTMKVTPHLGGLLIEKKEG